MFDPILKSFFFCLFVFKNIKNICFDIYKKNCQGKKKKKVYSDKLDEIVFTGDPYITRVH